MTTTLGIIVAFVVGILVGLFYFAGLWWTVRRIPESKYPGMLLLGSMAIRLGVLLAVFLLVVGTSWIRLLAAVVGFILARTILVRFVRGKTGEPGETVTEEKAV